MIRNILFDFGNVFVELDMNRFNTAVKSYLGSDFSEVYRRHSRVFDDFETGRLSQNEFIEAMTSIGLPQNQVLNIWNLMVKGIPCHRIEFLRKLQGRFRLFLYSNTNETHATQLDRLLQQQCDMSMQRFRALFDGTWFSYEIGHRKPDAGGFQYILDQTGIRPEETLFIDDTIEYLQGGLALGFRGALHSPEKDIAEVFPQYLEEIKSKID